MSSPQIFQRTFSVLVENEPGVLSRIAGLFSARGYNIVSLAVGETQDPTMSRMTIVAEGTPGILEQINKQLNKLIPVISVLQIPDEEMIVQELLLVKLEPDPGIPAAVKKLADQGRAVSVLFEGPRGVILRIASSRGEEPAILEALGKFKWIEVCRTGEVALSKEKTFGFLDRHKRDTHE